MITRWAGDIAFECDRCGRELDTGTDEWIEALVELRSNEWKSRKVGEEWTHLCPDCCQR
jgi:hypothetical protein